jgi:aminoglycoside phosphotransferase (APT) family kinase protein
VSPTTGDLTPAWRRVAEHDYGLREVTDLGERAHYHHHHFLTARPGPAWPDGPARRFVLSRCEPDPLRLPFEHQFAILTAITCHTGLPEVAMPRATVDGAAFASRHGARWMLRDHVDHDPSPDWTRPDLVRRAARLLAGLHDATAAAGTDDDLPHLDPDRVHAFHWSVQEFSDRIDRFAPPPDQLVLDTVEELRKHANAVLDVTRGELGLHGLTHQDFRPQNLLVAPSGAPDAGRIRAVIDWDLARRDDHLYDMALAALQFGDNRCLGARADMDLAGLFVDTYLAARGLVRLRREHPWLVPWMLRLVVVKRLLTNGPASTSHRIALLKRLVGSDIGRWPG